MVSQKTNTTSQSPNAISVIKMNPTNMFIGLLLITLSACKVLKSVYKLIDQKEDYYWTNTIGESNYLLTIDQANGKWFTGKMIINAKDTLFLKGFEKGSNHPTSVIQSMNDSINKKYLGYIFIWSKGYHADTIVIKNSQDSIPQLPINFVLIRTKKTENKGQKP